MPYLQCKPALVSGLHPSGNPKRYVTVTLKVLPWTPKGRLLHLSVLMTLVVVRRRSKLLVASLGGANLMLILPLDRCGYHTYMWTYHVDEVKKKKKKC